MTKRYVSNYARHVGDGGRVLPTRQVVLFGSEPPMAEHEFVEWAFHCVPDGHRADKFTGKLIGESDNMRAERLRCHTN